MYISNLIYIYTNPNLNTQANAHPLSIAHLPFALSVQVRRVKTVMTILRESMKKMGKQLVQ